MPAMIVLGDKTDHGGEVIEASGVTDTHGKRIARVGDKVHCPKKGHGTAVITTGDNTMIVDGKAVAYHGCKTSCGATLISSQAVTKVSFGSSADSGPASSPTARTNPLRQAVAGDVAQTEKPRFDLHFFLKDDMTSAPLVGMPYKITLDTGEEFFGLTDASGLTQTVGSDSQRIAYLEAPYYGDIGSSSDTHHEHDSCGC